MIKSAQIPFVFAPGIGWVRMSESDGMAIRREANGDPVVFWAETVPQEGHRREIDPPRCLTEDEFCRGLRNKL